MLLLMMWLFLVIYFFKSISLSQSVSDNCFFHVWKTCTLFSVWSSVLVNLPAIRGGAIVCLQNQYYSQHVYLKSPTIDVYLCIGDMQICISEAWDTSSGIKDGCSYYQPGLLFPSFGHDQKCVWIFIFWADIDLVYQQHCTAQSHYTGTSHHLFSDFYCLDLTWRIYMHHRRFFILAGEICTLHPPRPTYK